MSRVRDSSPALFLVAFICFEQVYKVVSERRLIVRAFSIYTCDSLLYAHVAQLVEHTLGKGEVTGSNPVMGSCQEKLSFFNLVGESLQI